MTGGFGAGVLGDGPFGSYNWARQVLWNDLPEIDRRLDVTEGNGALERWQEATMPLFQEILTFARDFEQLRDPDTVRTKFQDTISVTIDLAEATGDGRTIRVVLNDPDPSDPFVPLGRTSVGWILIASDGKEYTVAEVHKQRSEIIVTGKVELPPLGAATLRPPALIGLLGADYGFTVDQHDPEGFQRSTIRNAWQWLAMKGSQRGYQIIGNIAGYEVYASELWRLGNPVPLAIPSDHLWEMPVGSGKWYTDLAPLVPYFDEIAADVIPADMFCWETPDWQGSNPISHADDIVPPGDPVTGSPLPNGTPVSDAIGYHVQGLPVLGSVSLGGGVWRITVGPGVDLWPIASFGNWYGVFAGMPTADLYLETQPVDLGAGTWEFDVVAGAAPTFGATVDFRYRCHDSGACWYCKASVLRIVMIPTEILLEPDALMDDAIGRLVRKIWKGVPVHVRLTDLIYLTGPVSALVRDTDPSHLHLYATAAQQEAIVAFAQVGYRFDMTPGDVMPADPPHMVGQGTQFTIP
jgi:hypothetical protein